MKTIISKNYKETRNAGFEFAKQLVGGEVILLKGELGAGKTTFMQGFAKGLGITKNIISPTFIIMRSYELSEAIKVRTLYHADLYRIEDEKDIYDIGLLDVMGDDASIVAIEWPEKMGSLLPKDHIRIHIEYKGEHERTITIQ